MQIQNQSQIKFGSEGTDRGQAVLSSVGSSLLNVGATALVGGSIGGGIGKIASLTKYTPNEAAMNFQYADIFEKAIKNEKIPEYLKDKGDDVIELVKNGAKSSKNIDSLASMASETEAAANYISKIKPDKFSSAEVLEKLKDTSVVKNLKSGEATQQGFMDSLSKAYDKLAKSVQDEGLKLAEAQEKFVEKAAQSKDGKIFELAKKGAKDIRKKSIIGAGIGIGIIAALVLNILRTYGVIGKRGAKSAQTPDGAQTAQAGAIQTAQAAAPVSAAQTAQTASIPVQNAAGAA